MKNKKLITSLLVCVLTFVSACEGNINTNANNVANDNTQTLIEDLGNIYDLKEDGMYSASTHPLILSIFVHYEDMYTFRDDLISQEITEYTNIIFNSVGSQYSNDSEKEFAMLMSQPKLPDIIGGTLYDISKYGAEEAFIPLQDFINAYAPNIRAMFEKYPEAKASVTDSEGNIYAIPFVNEVAVSNQWWIRKDWLDELGLQVPTTIAEFEKVLSAFKTKDPNGNSEADEIPLFQNLGNGVNDIIPLFGVNPFFHLDEYGKVQIGSYTEEYKEAIKGVSSWFTQGYIHKDIFNSNVGLGFFDANTGGITFGNALEISKYNYLKEDGSFYVVGIAPPTDINGVRWVATNTSVADTYGIGISVDNSFPTETIKMLDFLFSKPGSTLMTYGILNETYKISAEGQETYIGDTLNIYDTLKNMGAMIKAVPFILEENAVLQLMHKEGVDIYNVYKENNYENIINSSLKTLCFNEEELEVILNIYPACEEYIFNKTMEWTKDSTLIDLEFEEYMQNLSSLGINEVLSAYQSAYNRFRLNVE
ncbi:MAG: extracellular solute-binding protein [Clostridia bacterium]